jgi:predicted ATPase
VVFDNCEHLLDDCADWVDRLLSHCPHLTVLATSREALDVEGEQSWRVPSLSVPEAASAADIMRSEAVSLFIARAQAVNPDFALSDNDVSAVGEICRRLDGIPLAIEFAAARVAHLSVRQIADRLDDMFRLLTGGRRRVQRQQTLRAALDWSYDLLEDDERLLLARLAVFPGTFSLDAVEGVCFEGKAQPHRAIDTIASLVAKSLVMADQSGEDVRYRLLETVRAYAEEKLREAGESERVRNRHLDYYDAWIRDAPLVSNYFSAARGQAFEREIDNLRGALDWSLVQSRQDVTARMAGQMASLWTAGRPEEAHRWLLAALEGEAHLSRDDLVLVYATLTNCGFMRASGDLMGWSERAVEAAAGQLSGPLVVATALWGCSYSVVANAEHSAALAAESRRLGDEAIAMAAKLDEPAWGAFAHEFRADSELDLDNVGAGAAFYRGAIALWEASEPSNREILSRHGLCVSLHVLGDVEGALAAVNAMKTRGQLLTSLRGAWSGEAAALALAGAGDIDGARSEVSAMLDLVALPAFSGRRNSLLCVCAAVEAQAGEWSRASRLLAASVFADVDPGRAFLFQSPFTYAVYQHYRPLVRAALTADDAHRYREEGRQMSLDEAIAYARHGA